MHRTHSAITLCAAVLGCSPGQAPGDPPRAADAPVQRPADPPESPPASPAPVVPKVWQLRLTTQFLGTVPGPLQVVSVDSTGPVKVEVDGEVVGEQPLPGAELEPLARLLAAPELAAAKSVENGPGPQTRLVVTGDLRMDLHGQLAELAPVLREVDRLRDRVGPPEHFKIVAADADTEVLVSSNGHVEIKRGGAEVVTHDLPTEALGKVRALLGVHAIRTASTWTAPAGTASLRIDGDITVSGVVDRTINGPAPALLAEAMRLGAAVAAKAKPPANFEAVFTQQLHGAGLGPLRTFTVRSSDRHLVLVDEAPDVKKSDRPLKDEEWSALVDMLVDPGLRLATGTPPSGEGMVYRVKITGDQPMDATFRGSPPPLLAQLLSRLDWLARHH